MAHLCSGFRSNHFLDFAVIFAILLNSLHVEFMLLFCPVLLKSLFQDRENICIRMILFRFNCLAKCLSMSKYLPPRFCLDCFLNFVKIFTILSDSINVVCVLLLCPMFKCPLFHLAMSIEYKRLLFFQFCIALLLRFVLKLIDHHHSFYTRFPDGLL